jgi:hypothetical protein
MGQTPGTSVESQVHHGLELQMQRHGALKTYLEMVRRDNIRFLWIYFFPLILVAGAEVVAIGSIREAEERGEEVGPEPDGTVPQQRMLRKRHPSTPAT